MAQIYGRNLLDTLHERVGEQEQLTCSCALDANRNLVNGTWGRVIGVRGQQGAGSIYDDDMLFSYSMAVAQIGMDLYRNQHEDGRRDHAGVYGAAGYLNGNVGHYTGADAGQNSFSAYSAGAYATHYGGMWTACCKARGTRT
ncbi:autotransporter outer membrane beta-barrel domain-containing protein [Burkholderia pyrrocinia]|uniref:autotransporter outer membrane beta-barrel domain-containing protein n=1 Tax=Burkholderia pyrrocinia TaxID=60550 RepID=UPI00158D60F2|nr:autotransporter outer membrane beta-barrel domain-containing protein [Burkholderia pyrrocinia]